MLGWMMASRELVKEIETYKTHLAEWADREGKFVLIGGAEVCGFFDTYEEALTAGYGRFGLVPFLVKKVLQQQRTHFVTRLTAPYPAG